MSKESKENTNNRDRVKRYRERQAERGRSRIDSYLDRETFFALCDYAGVKEMGIKDAAARLIQIGLRVEGKISAPGRFWDVILDKARRYRYR